MNNILPWLRPIHDNWEMGTTYYEDKENGYLKEFEGLTLYFFHQTELIFTIDLTRNQFFYANAIAFDHFIQEPMLAPMAYTLPFPSHSIPFTYKKKKMRISLLAIILTWLNAADGNHIEIRPTVPLPQSTSKGKPHHWSLNEPFPLQEAHQGFVPYSLFSPTILWHKIPKKSKRRNSKLG